MVRYLILFVFAYLNHFQDTSAIGDTYSAVVVEYSSTQDPTVDAPTNILNNVRNYVNIINYASDNYMADIIVFPEAALIGYGNQQQYLQVPDPEERARPCATNTSYEAPLIQLSCAARATVTYVVVNLAEKFYDNSQQKTVYYNTDVVFDANGTIIARYRKIHLFSEDGKSPSPNKELVYFDTAFGVRFGIFTCFDIIFEDPGVILANKFNITHFIFPTAWFSQMPFLTAIQEQYYWSYTQDVVLLASGYNDPSVGSTGTGIYLGRLGPATYNMVEQRQTFLLHAMVPKKLNSSKGNASEEIKTNKIIIPTPKEALEYGNGSLTKIKLKQENFLKMYTSELIVPPTSAMQGFNGTDFIIPFTMEEMVCQNSLCCKFFLNITTIFNRTRENVTRGDDYSQLYYRLAVFDGVRHYDNIANGGLQTCAIISCVNTNISSCGLRSDDSSAQPNSIYSFFQTDFIFNSIAISGNFSNNRSSVGPNVLLSGEGSDFGSLLPPESFTFVESQETLHDTDERSFQTVKAIPKLVTASVYGRLFFRDNSSSNSSQPSSSERNIVNNFFITFVFFVSVFNHY